MKSFTARAFAAVLAVLAVLVIAGATAKSSSTLLQPDKLVVLSTSDVKGKTSPCG